MTAVAWLPWGRVRQRFPSPNVEDHGQPTAALPLQIFVYAISPFDEWHRQAWAGALVLIVLIVATISVVRLFAGRGLMKGTS